MTPRRAGRSPARREAWGRCRLLPPRRHPLRCPPPRVPPAQRLPPHDQPSASSLPRACPRMSGAPAQCPATWRRLNQFPRHPNAPSVLVTSGCRSSGKQQFAFDIHKGPVPPFLLKYILYSPLPRHRRASRTRSLPTTPATASQQPGYVATTNRERRDDDDDRDRQHQNDHPLTSSRALWTVAIATIRLYRTALPRHRRASRTRSLPTTPATASQQPGYVATTTTTDSIKTITRSPVFGSPSLRRAPTAKVAPATKQERLVDDTEG